MLIEVIPTLYTSTVGGDVVCSKVMPILEPSYREPRQTSLGPGCLSSSASLYFSMGWLAFERSGATIKRSGATISAPSRGTKGSRRDNRQVIHATSDGHSR